MKKVDIILSLLAGEGVAGLVYGLILGSGAEEVLGVKVNFLGWFLFIFLPILALAALWISYLIGKKFLFIFQVAKFLLIGVLATLLDLGVLNLLMWIFNVAAGQTFIVFKGISFLGATFSKYWGNKLWAFEQSEMTGVEKEFTQFFIVTLIGLGVNLGITSIIVNGIGPQLGIALKVWANIGAIAAALVGAVWNFLGYKFIVFKK